MFFSETDLSDFIEENDVKFIRMTFCDTFGNMKNIAIMPRELHRAITDGIPFNATGLLEASHQNLLLKPDTSTLSILPWRPQSGRVVRFFCKLYHMDGTPYEGDLRRNLRETMKSLQKQGYQCEMGTRCEFYLFETDMAGKPTRIPCDQGGYLDVAPLDKCENTRREICLSLEEMGLNPTTSCHKHGPGQNEIDFACSNPLTAADSEYGKRLEKLTGHIKEVDGLKVNFGVYEVVDVNAFACGDGSVRICAGLMDIMTDDEVMAVVGHEIGHVIHTDSKDAMKSAYLRSAVKNAAGAASSTVSKLTDSELGAMAEALAGAQYSQKQESEADDYGFEFSIKHNIDPYAMYNALNKLLELSAEAPKESKFQKMFSSHPDTAKRVARAKEKADNYTKNK